MKLHKPIKIAIIITVMAVVYVHQRVEVVKAGYELQKNRRYLSYLVDQNTNLMYNLSKLESPRNLLTSLNGEDMKFSSRRTRRLSSSQLAQSGPCKGEDSEGFIAKLVDLFTSKAEAKPHQNIY